MNEDDVITKKKLLIREFLGALQGNGDALGKLVMSLNDVNEGEFPAEAEVWTKDQLERAMTNSSAPSMATRNSSPNLSERFR